MKKQRIQLFFYAKGKSELKIVNKNTGIFAIVELDKFSGKQYDYNTILDAILYNYPNSVSVQIMPAAKRAIKEQAKKNQLG